MVKIVFEYRDKYSYPEWNKQECRVSSVEECKKIYGLGIDCEYRILSVEEESYPYIINAGETLDDLYPYLACESKEKAINLCKNNQFYKYLEVVYMPEDDNDTNEVVWRSWE